jgi:hypothetical protein
MYVSNNVTCDHVTNGKFWKSYLKKNSGLITIRRTVAFFSKWHSNSFFLRLNVFRWQADKIRKSSCANIVEQAVIIVPGAPSIVTDWENLRGFVAFKTSNTEMGGTAKNHLSIDHIGSHRRNTINRLEIFYRNCSYLDRFKNISTIYIEMNSKNG